MISKKFIQLALGVGTLALSSIGLAQTGSETTAAPKMSTADEAAHLQYRLENEGDVLAVVEAQEDGLLTVFHGRIIEVIVTGASKKVEREIHELLDPLVEMNAPLLKDLEFHLSLVTDLHGVSTSFGLQRLDSPGDYLLEVSVREIKGSGLVALDTIPRGGFDQIRGTLHQEFYSLFEGGDVLRINANYEQGLDSAGDGLSFFGSYQGFLGGNGAFFEIAAGNSSAKLNSMFLGSEDHGYATTSVSLMVGKDISRTQTFSRVLYAEGALIDDSVSNVGDSLLQVIRGSYFQREDAADGSRTSVGLTASWGKDDNNYTGTNNYFSSLRGGFGHIAPLSRFISSGELLIELFGQVASDETPGAELFYLGSSQSLRGFSRGQYAGNNGLTASLEFGWLNFIAGQTLRPFLFLDSGYIQNTNQQALSISRPKDNSVSSTGLGLDLFFKDTFASLRGWIGVPIYDAEYPSEDPFLYVQFQVAW
ncbi:MAG: ShlB/FhaC/HecB family hemolysin secretion/activation protein [Gammaproteobacteria bacterium]|jgi:hemolysin activation/secretion protein